MGKRRVGETAIAELVALAESWAGETVSDLPGLQE